jgi:hypothetical protein
VGTLPATGGRFPTPLSLGDNLNLYTPLSLGDNLNLYTPLSLGDNLNLYTPSPTEGYKYTPISTGEGCGDACVPTRGK